MEISLCETHQLIVRDKFGNCHKLVGRDGVDGKDGVDGVDGITPRLKIVEGIWQVSYDNGETWEELGVAIGSSGDDGKDGEDGISIYTAVIFMRSPSSQTTMPTPNKSEGSFDSPVPSGWSDSIPPLPLIGEYNKIWSSRRIFTKPYIASIDTGWSTPVVIEDVSDFDVCYSAEPKLTDVVIEKLPSQGNNEDNACWHNVGNTDDKWMATAHKKANGKWSDWTITQIKGDPGASVIVANIFIRSDVQPSTPQSRLCTFYNILPADFINLGWSDSIPALTSTSSTKVWASKRILSSDGNAPLETSWSTPVLILDSSNINICYSDSITEPSSNTLPSQDSSIDNNTWHFLSTAGDIWMAIASKSVGENWSNWKIIKIKYKDGASGINIKLQYALSANEFTTTPKTAPTDVLESDWKDNIPNLVVQGKFIWVKQTKQEWDASVEKYIDIAGATEYYRLTGSPGAPATSYIANLSNKLSGISCVNNRPKVDGFNFENTASLLYASLFVTSVMEVTNADVLLSSFGANIVEVDNTNTEVAVGTIQSTEHHFRIRFNNATNYSQFPEVIPINVKLTGIGEHSIGTSLCTFNIVPIEEGSDASFVELCPNKNSIVFDKESTESSTLTLTVDLKYVTGQSLKIDAINPQYTVKYSFSNPIESLNTSNTDVIDYTSAGIVVNPTITQVYLALIFDGRIIDRKTVAVIRDGKNGDLGEPGNDGLSCTHSWSGTTLTVTSASGTSSADLKGDAGEVTCYTFPIYNSSNLTSGGGNKSGTFSIGGNNISMSIKTGLIRFGKVHGNTKYSNFHMAIYGLVDFGSETTWGSIMENLNLYLNNTTYVGSISRSFITGNGTLLTILNRPTTDPSFKAFGAIHLSPLSNFPNGQETLAMIEVFGVIANPNDSFDDLPKIFDNCSDFGCEIGFEHENE